MKAPGSISRYLLGAVYILAGINHFANPGFYVPMMPPYLPWHAELVALSGACELGLGAAVLLPRFTRPAAWGIIALLIAVFPANLHMALHPELFPGFAPVGLWIRLPVQGLLIAWAYRHTRPLGGATSLTAPLQPS